MAHPTDWTLERELRVCLDLVAEFATNLQQTSATNCQEQEQRNKETCDFSVKLVIRSDTNPFANFIIPAVVFYNVDFVFYFIPM